MYNPGNANYITNTCQCKYITPVVVKEVNYFEDASTKKKFSFFFKLYNDYFLASYTQR